ncbi:hypothetical protein CXG81DRAFT_8914, partial [Caulochytrium protostelioides]
MPPRRTRAAQATAAAAAAAAPEAAPGAAVPEAVSEAVPEAAVAETPANPLPTEPTTASPPADAEPAAPVALPPAAAVRRRRAVQSRVHARFLALITPHDLLYEDACAKHPATHGPWLDYFASRADATGDDGTLPPFPIEAVCHIHERALQALPASYKLWMSLIEAMAAHATRHRLPPTHGFVRIQLADTCRRAAAFCHAMPVFWLRYAAIEADLRCDVTATRRAYDTALQALPTPQHDRIWPAYLAWARRVGGPTARRVYQRYVTIDASALETYVALLEPVAAAGADAAADAAAAATGPLPPWAELARGYTALLDHPLTADGVGGRSRFQLWQRLVDVLVAHPDAGDGVLSHHARLGRAATLDVEQVLRAGIATYTDVAGALWNALATLWLRRGHWARARAVFVEAVDRVATVRDFSLVFDAYVAFEEQMLNAAMEALDAAETAVADAATVDAVAADAAEAAVAARQAQVDLALAKLEYLLEQRPLMVNDVLLRQNPHSVHDWVKRLNLTRQRVPPLDAAHTAVLVRDVAAVLAAAIATIDPRHATGQLTDLWETVARMHETDGRLDAARATYRAGVRDGRFGRVEDLVALWSAYAAFEVRQDDYAMALKLLYEAVAAPRSMPPHVQQRVRFADASLDLRQRLFKSIHLWKQILDLEEAVGSVESAKAAYDHVIWLKLATPQIVMNYASFLQTHALFEASFRVYERGIDAFGWPVCFELWNAYLAAFIQRHGGTRLVRTRDLFRQALEHVPPAFARALYLRYAQFEEQYGQTQHVMRVFRDSLPALPPAERPAMFDLWLAKAQQRLGLAATRPIYQRAVETLDAASCKAFVLRFAQTEAALGEPDRARALFVYGAPLAHPATDAAYWKAWFDFEARAGSESSFREMLRVKRTVQARLDVDIDQLAAQYLAAKR